MHRVFLLRGGLLGILLLATGWTFASEPPGPAGRPLFAAPLSRTIAGKSAADAVSGLERATLRALRSGAVERLLFAEGTSLISFDHMSHKLRSTAATWVGGTPDGQRLLLLTIGDDHLFGRMVSDDGETLLVPGPEPFTVTVSRPPPGFEMEFTGCDDLGPMPSAVLRPIDAGGGKALDDGSLIDVMILYTDGMAGAHPGSQIDTRMQFLIDQANVSYTNSLISTELRLVYSAQVTYTDDSPGATAFDGLSAALNDVRNNVGVFAGVEALRTTHGADQVTLLRQYVDEACGIAGVLKWADARSAYSVVHDGSKTDGSGYYCSDLTYAHELGHNMGCAHDRDNASVSGRFDYSYGYQAPSAAFRTVMAYATGCGSPCTRISHFSNPNVTFGGEPTGVSQASAESADNAATINYTRTEMAAFRPTVYISTDEIFEDGFETGNTSHWSSTSP